MSLGVLNNLSSVYAENSLNNTNNSLSKTLQQLSSGSKINSGADDAAGLSLVDGLQANQQALSQSQTNATEGVGLLQVADGALSQVTSLLNRAVTLATEASNGTLNATQDAAANQEYQSILSEISNIGTTTTYNGAAVFNSNTNIYTGDSSTAGSSIDSLNIRSLSSSNVGDSNGAMAYNNGGNNVFIDLSVQNGTANAGNAGLNDSLSGTGAASVVVNYLQTSANGATVAASKTISVGGATGYSNTVGGMINAINGAGLGLTASFTTAGAAGDTTPGGNASVSDTGIQISGPGVSVGTTPGIVGSLGLATGGAGDATVAPSESVDLLQGNATIVGADGKTHTINLSAGNGNTGTTLDQLASTINSSGWGVTATISQTATGNKTQTSTLTLTSSNSNVSANLTGITDSTLDGSTIAPTQTDVATGTGPTGSSNPAPAYYGIGVTTGAGLKDVTTNVTVGSGGAIAAKADINSTGGTATMSYTDQAGQALSNTDLSSQSDSETALISLNKAITDVAAQDGYLGAQINTLNSVSQVLSTQQENVTSAQNAVQATDYASATSNMSKYEILSQTGISALAQANSMQQEVTKLLQ
jgi:flagellin